MSSEDNACSNYQRQRTGSFRKKHSKQSRVDQCNVNSSNDAYILNERNSPINQDHHSLPKMLSKIPDVKGLYPINYHHVNEIIDSNSMTEPTYHILNSPDFSNDLHTLQGPRSTVSQHTSSNAPPLKSISTHESFSTYAGKADSFEYQHDPTFKKNRGPRSLTKPELQDLINSSADACHFQHVSTDNRGHITDLQHRQNELEEFQGVQSNVPHRDCIIANSDSSFLSNQTIKEEDTSSSIEHKQPNFSNPPQQYYIPDGSVPSSLPEIQNSYKVGSISQQFGQDYYNHYTADEGQGSSHSLRDDDKSQSSSQIIGNYDEDQGSFCSIREHDEGHNSSFYSTREHDECQSSSSYSMMEHEKSRGSSINSCDIRQGQQGVLRSPEPTILLYKKSNSDSVYYDGQRLNNFSDSKDKIFHEKSTLVPSVNISSANNYLSKDRASSVISPIFSDISYEMKKEQILYNSSNRNDYTLKGKVFSTNEEIKDDFPFPLAKKKLHYESMTSKEKNSFENEFAISNQEQYSIPLPTESPSTDTKVKPENLTSSFSSDVQQCSANLESCSLSMGNLGASSSNTNLESTKKRKKSTAIAKVKSSKRDPIEVRSEFGDNTKKKCINTNQSKESRHCVVCEDNAMSMHFGALACDSCKAFFRRSVQNSVYKKFKCCKSRSCIINKDTRKHCPSCRFEKAQHNGMEVSWVMSGSSRIELWKSRLSKTRQAQLMKEEEEEYGSFPRSLTLEEVKVYKDLVNLMEQSFLSLPYPELCVGNTVEALANLFVCICKKLGVFFARLEDFSEICLEDQAILLKNGIGTSIYLHGAYMYDSERQVWPAKSCKEAFRIPLITMKTLEEFTVLPEAFETIMKFYKNCGKDMKDEVTLSLICIVAFFQTDFYPFKNSKQIQAIQEKYLFLLKKYLKAKSGKDGERVNFAKLLVGLADIREILEFHTKVDIKPTINPLKTNPSYAKYCKRQITAVQGQIIKSYNFNYPPYSSLLTPEEKKKLGWKDNGYLKKVAGEKYLNSYHPITNEMFGSNPRTDMILTNPFYFKPKLIKKQLLEPQQKTMNKIATGCSRFPKDSHCKVNMVRPYPSDFCYNQHLSINSIMNTRMTSDLEILSAINDKSSINPNDLVCLILQSILLSEDDLLLDYIRSQLPNPLVNKLFHSLSAALQ